jgi:hypothetical protein
MAVGTVTLGNLSRAIAGNDSWMGTSDGNWSDGTQWSNAAPPGAGDDAYITNSSNGTQTVTVDSYFDVNSLTVASTGGGINIVSISVSGNGLNIRGSEEIGSIGQGAVIQSNGGQIIFGNQSIGDGGDGTYTMSDGGLTIYGSQGIGSGTFNQSGGTNTVSNFLDVGNYPGATATYTLSSGSLVQNPMGSGAPEQIGYSGTGYFNQTGGTNTTLFLNIGTGGAHSTGTYTMSGGTLSGLQLAFGQLGSSAANFNQSGGTSTFHALFIGVSQNTGAYDLSGGSLTISKSETIGDTGIGTFNQSGGTNSMTGSAFLSVAQISGSTGSYSLTGGQLSVDGNAYIGGYTNAAGGIGSLSVSGAGQMNVGGTLQIYPSGTVMLGSPSTAYTTVGNLQISPGGLLDVTNSGLTINYGTNAIPNTTIRSFISNGYNTGGALWTGTGITSSTAAADPAHHSVAFADGADGVVTNLPAGISSAIPNGGVLPAGDELVTYAYAGDANLDGKVDFNDFVALSTHFLQPDINWDHGNFNYDGVVDFNDFVILSTNFGQGVTGGDGAGATAAQLAQFNAMAAGLGVSQSQIASWDAKISNLPEPASMGLFLLSGYALLRRRRIVNAKIFATDINQMNSDKIRFN